MNAETRYTAHQAIGGEWVVTNNRTGEVKSVWPTQVQASKAADTLERKRLANLRKFGDLYR